MSTVKEYSLSFYPHPVRANEAISVTTGGSVQSAPITGPSQNLTVQTCEVLVWASVDVYCTAGANPTASAATGKPIAAGNYVRTLVTRGDRLAFISVAQAGLVHVSEE